MFGIQPPHEEFDPDTRQEDCRAAVDTALSELIADAERKGWQPAEIVMALADAAEDYILLLAQRGAVRH